MPCPTCGHIVARLCTTANLAVGHCTRCGTATVRLLPSGRVVETYVPKLVERCRQFEERLPLVTAGDARSWHTLGLAESIRPPSERTE